MKSLYALGVCALLVGANAHAETLYTKLEDTPVRDKPVGIGSTVTAHLKAGTMIETVKAAGAFTMVSFILDGKVKTGFIATTQIKDDPNHKPTVAEAAQTTVGSEDVASMVNGFSDGTPQQTVDTKIQGLKSSAMPAGSEDPSALLTSKLESLSIPPADLSTFAKNGKLSSRKPKSKVTQ